ncbi:MAG: PAS-domain containing protein [Rhodobacteraceae bacterium]|nr:PAS-domain containing protein [Paracoccaceae bacterium]
MGISLSAGAIIALFSLLSAFSAIALMAALTRDPRRPPSVAGGRVFFLFRDHELADASPAALAMLGRPVDAHSGFAVVAEMLEGCAPGLRQNMEILLRDGTPFCLNGRSGGASVEICGRQMDQQVRIEVMPVTSADGPAPDVTGDLAEMAAHLPLLAWRCDSSGRVTWANRAYLEAADQGETAGECDSCAAALPVLFPAEAGTSLTGRRTLPGDRERAPKWFEVKSVSLENGQMLAFALHADPVVRAEAALRNFVQTLTKTFAHLPIGLAIFDRDRQLALFNPALSDLTALDPGWLSARPSLTGFLDRMREQRRLPEPKDYKGWRQRIADLERAAEDGTYEEHWPLPTGQTYRVTGRPHPEGAVAFLFEDITASITLQRQFRAELDLGQAVLDTMPDAIAVFAANGDLVLSNDAYAAMWGNDPRELLVFCRIAEAVGTWQGACRPSPELQALAGWPERKPARQAFSTDLVHKRKGALALTVTPLSQGALLCTFREGLSGAPVAPPALQAMRETALR